MNMYQYDVGWSIRGTCQDLPRKMISTSHLTAIGISPRADDTRLIGSWRPMASLINVRSADVSSRKYSRYSTYMYSTALLQRVSSRLIPGECGCRSHLAA